MRILYLSHYALPHAGGIETAIDALPREMTARGHEVTHLAARVGGPAPQPPRGGRLVEVPASNLLERRFDIPYPLFSPRLLETLRREIGPVDVVHAHGFLYLPTVLGLRLRGSSGKRPGRVLTEHVGTVDYGNRGLNALESMAVSSLGRASVRAADAVIVLNDAVHEEVERLDRGARVLTIENGVDLERFHPADANERETLRTGLGWNATPRVLFVGRVVPKKRPELAIEATRRASGAFELVMVGRGRRPLALPPEVEFLGELSMERIARLYRAADVLLLPSTGEGFPLAVQEAMASGLPVVLADDPIYKPYLDDAGPGARFVEPDPSSIALTLTELLESPRERASAAERALDHARTRFSWTKAADLHEALYRELC